MRPFLAAIFLPLAAAAKDIPVADAAALEAAIQGAQPGDAIVLSAGTWPDVVIKFIGHGTKAQPITLRAETPGKTVLTGKSALRIGGEYLVVDGLSFHNPDPAAGDTIEFRKDSKGPLAQYCRLTNCAVIQEKPDAGDESHWIGIYGADNRIDHCLIQGKGNRGTTLVVWLDNDQKGRHQIDHNYFGPRERLGKNGGEIIRIGDSKTSMQTAACVIESNLFERCNGEVECISNKSCGNIYRNNTFSEVSGTLTLRHGNGCTVEGNVFIGNDVNGTGGVRIIGEDHVVRNNYFENLEGDDARCAITLMMGIPDSPLNRYFQVKRARVEGNLLVNCEHSILIGLADDKKATLTPVDTVFVGNQVHSPKHAVIEARCAIDGIRWEKNTFWGKELGIPDTPGIASQEPKIEPRFGIDRSAVGPAWAK